MDAINYMENGLLPQDIPNIKNICTNRKRHNKKTFYKQFYTFDIEVTNYTDGKTKAGIPYLWILSVDKDRCYYGRDIAEFMGFLSLLEMELEKHDIYFVIYVHNLSYEWQFIRKYITWDEVFLLDERKPLYVRYGKIYLRCSYLYSNMNLDNFLKNNGTELQKLNYDYDKQRFAWTPLSEDEFRYCYNDTAGLYECMHKIMDVEKTNVACIPLTSTSYVRRDIKRAVSEYERKLIKRLSNIDVDLYRALHAAFNGGNTHANRFYAGKILNDIECYDITSSYPHVQLTELYPVKPFRVYNHPEMLKYLDPAYAYLLHVTFHNIRLSEYIDGCPTISTSKCITLSQNAERDNGRVVRADLVELWLTDIEFNIIGTHYIYDDIEISEAYFSEYGEIPLEIKQCIYDYFKNKCTLKGKDDYLYRKSKEKLNSIYGMSAFDIGKARFKYIDDDYVRDNRYTEEILQDVLQHSSQAEPYAWGVWTTAHARKNLNDMILEAGTDFVYCDTDSIYTRQPIDIEPLNDEIRRKVERWTVDFEGKKYNTGIWKHEKTCKQFITQGAKKYCYTDFEDNVYTVTAGISKKAGCKNINDFKIGHIFKDATFHGLYTDNAFERDIDGHHVYLPSNLYIEKGDYTLGLTDDYNAILYFLNDTQGRFFSYG